MAFEDYKQKDSLVIVYTGEGKGKTSAAIGLMARALGTGWSVAFIQFIKHWEVGEHVFIKQIQKEVYKDRLFFFKGGEGFFQAGGMSAKGVSEQQHREAAKRTYDTAFEQLSSGQRDVVICDEINNAVNDGLLSVKQLEALINAKPARTTLCLTGRNFPRQLLEQADIATDMNKLRHHFDEKFLANKGIDY